MSDPTSLPPSPPDEAPRKYAWPKYVLAAVTLFFAVCIWWTFKEISRLKRAKAEGMETPRTSQTTN